LGNYFLALLGEPRGLPALIQYWREQHAADKSWQRLVYRAIAALNDDAQVPVLDEIYKNHERYEVREFYWSIRGMTGPQALELRKKIRKEVGMDYLR
jgi:hypothetical protein